MPLSLRSVAEPEARPRPMFRHTVARIENPAARQRQTPAANAVGESALESLQLGDTFGDPCAPRRREPRPLLAVRCESRGKLRQLAADLVQRQAHALREYDEGNASCRRARISAVPRLGACRLDEATVLVEAECRSGHARARRKLTNGEQVSEGPGTVGYGSVRHAGEIRRAPA